MFVWEIFGFIKDRKIVQTSKILYLAFWMVLVTMLVITSLPALSDDYPQNWIHTLAAVSTKFILFKT